MRSRPIFQLAAGLVAGFQLSLAHFNDQLEYAVVDQERPVQQVLSPPITDPPLFDDDGKNHEFKLRHIFHHGTYEYPDLHLKQDVHPDVGMLISGGPEGRRMERPLTARSRLSEIERMVDRSAETVERLLLHGQTTGQAAILGVDDWTIDRVSSPDPTDRETVLTMARIAANAYVQDESGAKWESVTGKYNHTLHFGWEGDGIRGHIFVDHSNSTVIIGLKGTSPALFDGTDTTMNDKLNDNLFFSCCCGQGGSYWWKQVCDCQTDAFTCNVHCLNRALRHRNLYYYAAQELYRNVTALYPHSQVWLAGHSLGGAVSSLVGMTLGIPVFAFEAPGDAMPAARLGLPVPPGYQLGFHQQRAYTGTYHFGHTADPIFMGTCNTGTSSCTLARYAMESVCHTGFSCVYDTVEDFGWRAGIGTHRIQVVIDEVLLRYDKLPACLPRPDCVDCFNWKYDNSKHNSTHTSTSTATSTTTDSLTATPTRTEICKTPGWWGCLDESTTATTTPTSTATTTTCTSPGWFGCNDPPVTTTSTPPTPTTTSCQTPGWFGCNDPTPTPTTETPPPSPTTTTCESPGWFGCNDPVVTPTSSVSSAPTAAPTTTTSSCLTPGWFSCLDEPTPTPTTPPPGPPSTSPCATPGWFGCYDPTSTTETFSVTPTSSCATPGWLGCRDQSTTSSRPQSSSWSPTTTATTTSCQTPGWFGCKDPVETGAVQPHQVGSPAVTST